MPNHSLLSVLASAGVLASCGGGAGGEFGSTEQTVLATCDECHDPAAFEGLLADIRAVDDAEFDAARFPDEMFSVDLRELRPEELARNANPPRDAELDPRMARRKAWLLHEMHTLEVQLQDTPPSDFTRQELFDAYIAGGGAVPLGCETIDRLDLAELGSPSQMPPPWTGPLFELIGRAHVPLDDESRAALRRYVETGLPGGMASCF
jgi:hypothetical protein